MKTIESLTKYQREKHERKVKTTLSLLRLLPLRSILSTNFTRFFHGIDYIFGDAQSPEHAGRDVRVTRVPSLYFCNTSTQIVRVTRVPSLYFCNTSTQIRRARSFECIPQKQADGPAVTAYLRDFLDAHATARDVAPSRTLSQQPFRDAKLFLCSNDDFQDAEKRLPPLVKGFDPPVLHIHGTSKPTCTKKAYRHLQTENPSYLEFLRCMFASNRMLFYGYSRSDSYVNDVRDQVMTMLEQGHRQREDALAPVLGCVPMRSFVAFFCNT